MSSTIGARLSEESAAFSLRPRSARTIASVHSESESVWLGTRDYNIYQITMQVATRGILLSRASHVRRDQASTEAAESTATLQVITTTTTMGHSDSEDEVENNDVFEFDGRSSEADDMDEDLFDANEDADEGTEHGEVRCRV